MKLQPDRFDVPAITGYGPGWVGVSGEQVAASVVIGSRGQRLDWQCDDFGALTASHFAQLATLDAELVIFGSGQRLRFVPAAWLQPLMARRIGLETMDTQAACRTYNILAGEGRNVIAALLIEPAG
ncbi:MAG: Mth938-like domain-containing protein [Burkholderiales bacterium]|nr:Mth938-like domain-containing protein [Burkholderiales bacterium]